jgi:hypothetical protein
VAAALQKGDAGSQGEVFGAGFAVMRAERENAAPIGAA